MNIAIKKITTFTVSMIALSMPLSANGLFDSVLDSVTGGFSGGSGGFSVGSVLGQLGADKKLGDAVGGGFVDVTLHCDNGGLFKIVDVGDSVCEASNDITNILKSSNGGFSIGGCDVSIGGGQECYYNTINDACKGMTKDSVMTPLKAALASVEELTLLRGVGIKSTQDCEKQIELKDKKYPSGMTVSEVYEETSADRLIDHGYGPFDSSVDSLRDCMKVHGKKCLEDGFVKLPATTADAEKEISKTANIIASGDESVTANAPTVEAEQEAKKSDCTKLEGAARTKCENEVKNGDNSTQSAAQKAIAKLETAAAVEVKTMKTATESTKYVHRTKKFVTSLPKHIQKDIEDGIARQNTADILILSLFNELTALKKEAIYAVYGDADTASESYTAGGAVDAVQTSLGLNVTGSGTVGSNGEKSDISVKDKK